MEERIAEPYTYWFTGLPCSGKTTLAENLKIFLEKKGYKVIHLDGDNIRKTLCAGLGFSEEHRKENLRRVSHAAKKANERGYVVLASFVSPTEEIRKIPFNILGKDLKLIYVNCNLERCVKRDVKGMYKRAINGEIPNFTGISKSAPFEEPLNPSLIINTEEKEASQCIEEIVKRFNL